jgi:Mg2+ and Co2+ transporter CorA
MNVHVPGQGEEGTFYWFFGIIGGMIVVSMATAYMIRSFKLKGKGTTQQ